MQICLLSDDLLKDTICILERQEPGVRILEILVHSVSKVLPFFGELA